MQSEVLVGFSADAKTQGVRKCIPGFYGVDPWRGKSQTQTGWKWPSAVTQPESFGLDRGHCCSDPSGCAPGSFPSFCCVAATCYEPFRLKLPYSSPAKNPDTVCESKLKLRKTSNRFDTFGSGTMAHPGRPIRTPIPKSSRF